ncbi:SDR family oxidoreductase [Streptomyces sp. NPDC003509]
MNAPLTHHSPRPGRHPGLLPPGRIALVTGASRGLGRAVAHRLRTDGCHVYLNYAHDDVAAADAVEAAAGLPGSTTPVKGDIRSADFLDGLLDRIRDDHGQLDILVHNAATMHPMLPVAPEVAPLFDEIALALNPLLHGAATVAKLMPEGGRVVAVSGNGAFEVIPHYLATGVAKAALENLVRYLAVDLAPFGITVNAVSTHLLDKGEHTSNPAIAGLLASRTPNGRLTRPEDVADVIALLCAPEAAWIQGQVVVADGGLGLRA